MTMALDAAFAEGAASGWSQGQSDARQIGLLTWLAMIGDTHYKMPTGDFELALSQALRTPERLRLIRHHGRPVAWLAWEWLDETGFLQRVAAFGNSGRDSSGCLGERVECACHYAGTGAPRHLWWPFWVRPWGCDEEFARYMVGCAEDWWPQTPCVSWFDPSRHAGRGALFLHVPFAELHHYADQEIRRAP